ncbi:MULTISPECIES: hypothetical protein [Rhodococcus erythropolis group]|uniref:Toxin-antitoxin system n=1 Tax=Rhodococcus erythropolis TaxID=1833 RepID=A0A0E4AFE1_RHOER|nr:MULTISPECIES: hypothetical protein [Rhodococcus erythropolis group]AKE01325.1 hypothetical protein XU06_30830 [Rhodococcus erythropolis]MBH5147535.1 toxin-antitoxin system [Rhodococcus erythropolis]MBO8150488.1 toxin-antitoxin system [Rhodococcus erythropolis]MDO1492686.1 toxin-antitoxin system [Rhodococcus erythropolis]MYV31845.1 toxin-antitoxin system [Rhodococcus erythropolis]
MPTPSKGDRTRVVSRVPDPVYAELEKRRKAAGVSSVSQYVADLLAATTGHQNLVVELDQEVLQLTA